MLFELKPTTCTAKINGGQLLVDFNGEEWTIKVVDGAFSRELRSQSKIALELSWVPRPSPEKYNRGYIPLYLVSRESLATPHKAPHLHV